MRRKVQRAGRRDASSGGRAKQAPDPPGTTAGDAAPPARVTLRRALRLGHRVMPGRVQRYVLTQVEYLSNESAAVVDHRENHEDFAPTNKASLHDGTYAGGVRTSVPGLHAEILILGEAAQDAGTDSDDAATLLDAYRALGRNATLYTERRPCNDTLIGGLGPGGCAAYLNRALAPGDTVNWSFTTNAQHAEAMNQLELMHQDAQVMAEMEAAEQGGGGDGDVAIGGGGLALEGEDVAMEAGGLDMVDDEAEEPPEIAQVDALLGGVADNAASRAQVAHGITTIVEDVLLAADVLAQPNSWLQWVLASEDSAAQFEAWVESQRELIRMHG